MLQVPDPGAGEGVSHEPLPHQAQEDRDGTPALPHRATDQNLVPKQVGTISRYKYNISIQKQVGTISRNQLNNPEQVGTISRNQLNSQEKMATISRYQLNNPEQVGTNSRYYSYTIQNRWAPFPDTIVTQSRTGGRQFQIL